MQRPERSGRADTEGAEVVKKPQRATRACDEKRSRTGSTAMHRARTANSLCGLFAAWRGLRRLKAPQAAVARSGRAVGLFMTSDDVARLDARDARLGHLRPCR